jgi:hypothetical protein
MSKLALINRNEKRKKLVLKFAKRRAALEAIIANPKMSDDDKFAARLKIQQLPRNAHPTRVRNRLRADRPPARRVLEVRPRPQQAARVRDARRSSGRRQGQLVSGSAPNYRW